MGVIDRRLIELGLTLPDEPRLPAGARVPFAWVRVHRDRAFVSGHSALTTTGEIAGPLGKVPTVVSVDAAQASARSTVLAILGSLARALGDLDRIAAWLTLTGFVNADPGFAELTRVLNPASELLLDVFGPVAGEHARIAPGVAALPFEFPVVLAAEVALVE